MKTIQEVELWQYTRQRLNEKQHTLHNFTDKEVVEAMFVVKTLNVVIYLIGRLLSSDWLKERA